MRSSARSNAWPRRRTLDVAATPSLRWLASANARRHAILLVVGVFGLLITAWVTRSLHDVERERLQLRF